MIRMYHDLITIGGHTFLDDVPFFLGRVTVTALRAYTNIFDRKEIKNE